MNLSLIYCSSNSRVASWWKPHHWVQTRNNRVHSVLNSCVQSRHHLPSANSDLLSVYILGIAKRMYTQRSAHKLSVPATFEFQELDPTTECYRVPWHLGTWLPSELAWLLWCWVERYYVDWDVALKQVAQAPLLVQHFRLCRAPRLLSSTSACAEHLGRYPMLRYLGVLSQA